MNPTLQDALEFYKKQVTLAEDRIRLFQIGEMSAFDLRPPRRDTTAEVVGNERQIILNFQRGIEIATG